MPALSEYNNVYNTALLIIQKRGYQIWYNKESDLYGAEKDGWDFVSPSPCGLLGLIYIFEYKSPDKHTDYWWKEEGPDVRKDLPKEARPYRPVWKK